LATFVGVTFPGRRAPTSEPDWLTLGQAAKFLGVAQSTIRKWSDQGRVPAFYTPGGHRRYRRRDLETFLERSGPGGRTDGPLVLVVDDDARLREFMRVNLEMEGYSVREAASAEEALEAIEGSTSSTWSCPASMGGRCCSGCRSGMDRSR
jgi:excisionase family DNA binding protein